MRLRILPLLLTLAGCHSPLATPDDFDAYREGERVEGVSLAVDKAAYAVGESVRIALTNSSSSPIGYNACLSFREEYRDGRWEAIHPLRLCTADLTLLPASDRVGFQEIGSADWPRGRYRTVLDIHKIDGNRSFTVRTAAFDVGE